uniref:Uncharacterized protein n=1 Tax=Lutzomyia longipalpis TaxID=7200 RepID=A0A1B0CMC4_LUTLO
MPQAKLPEMSSRSLLMD